MVGTQPHPGGKPPNERHVCVCVRAQGGDAISKRKTCMGLRALAMKKEGGVPADEPPHLTVGEERAPLPRMRPSPRPEPLWGGGGYGRAVALGVCVCAGVSPFLPGLPVGPVWPLWRPRVGLLPIIAGPRCRPGVHPCISPRPVRYALRPEPGSLPQDHPGSGVVAPWLLPGQLHGISSTSPSSPCRPMCCVYWGFHSWWCSQQGIDPTTLRLRDLRLARLS